MLKKYKIIVGAYFIQIGNEREIYGLFTTFVVNAGNAKSAVAKLHEKLRDRVTLSEIQDKEVGCFRTRYFIHRIWEMEDQVEGGQREEEGQGFSFFRMSRISRMVALARVIYLQSLKPHLLLTTPLKVIKA